MQALGWKHKGTLEDRIKNYDWFCENAGKYKRVKL
jgi:hypothetical protein